MKTCKNCIHSGVCGQYLLPFEKDNVEEHCESFKDKFKFLELPCSPGDFCIWNGAEWYINVIEWDGEDFVLWVSPANKQACSAEVLASEVRLMTKEEVDQMFEEINNERKKYL